MNIFNEINKKEKERIKMIKQRRNEGYAFINDYEVHDVVVKCKSCDWRDDIEKSIITKHTNPEGEGVHKIIPLTCPECLSQELEIVDERGSV